MYRSIGRYLPHTTNPTNPNPNPDPCPILTLTDSRSLTLNPKLSLFYKIYYTTDNRKLRYTK